MRNCQQVPSMDSLKWKIFYSHNLISPSSRSWWGLGFFICFVSGFVLLKQLQPCLRFTFSWKKKKGGYFLIDMGSTIEIHCIWKENSEFCYSFLPHWNFSATRNEEYLSASATHRSTILTALAVRQGGFGVECYQLSSSKTSLPGIVRRSEI